MRVRLTTTEVSKVREKGLTRGLEGEEGPYRCVVGLKLV